MDIFNKGSSYLNDSISSISNDAILGPIIAILLILFAVLVAPKLPQSTTKFVNNVYFKIIFIIIIILLANKHLAVSLICLIIFFVIINNKSTVRLQEMPPQIPSELSTTIIPTMTMPPMIQEPTMTMPPMIQEPTMTMPQMIQEPTMTMPTMIQEPTMTMPTMIQEPTMTMPTMIQEPTMPTLPPQVLDNNIINGSALPITPDITPTTVSTIINMTPTVDTIVSQIKENFTDYIDNTIKNEEILRNQIKSETNHSVVQELDNSANKLVVARNAVTSIVNNNNTFTNDQILTNLVKSDYLIDASNNAMKNGDCISADQLRQASLSQTNIVNSLLQCEALKSAASNAQKNGLVKESTKLLDNANTHLESSINMINYNHTMEKALDAHTKGNYDQSKMYEQHANEILRNNITLNDEQKGIPVELSTNLYAKVPPSNSPDVHLIPPNIPPKSQCDNINAVNISGWTDFGYANF